jgi:hypothetical protein
MATKKTTSKTSTVKAKTDKTSAPKLSRARKIEPGAAPMIDAVPAMMAAPRDAVALRAYEIFCARGHHHGHDVEDWLAAERELSAR